MSSLLRGRCQWLCEDKWRHTWGGGVNDYVLTVWIIKIKKTNKICVTFDMVLTNSLFTLTAFESDFGKLQWYFSFRLVEIKTVSKSSDGFIPKRLSSAGIEDFSVLEASVPDVSLGWKFNRNKIPSSILYELNELLVKVSKMTKITWISLCLIIFTSGNVLTLQFTKVFLA
jgi:hypothetical protein